MKRAERLAKLARLAARSFLTREERAELALLRDRVRQNDHLRRRYREDPAYRAKKMGYKALRRLQAAE